MLGVLYGEVGDDDVGGHYVDCGSVSSSVDDGFVSVFSYDG